MNNPCPRLREGRCLNHNGPRIFGEYRGGYGSKCPGERCSHHPVYMENKNAPDTATASGTK